MPDRLGLSEGYAPQITDGDVTALREARRELGSDISYLKASLPQLVELPEATELLRLHRDLSQYEKLRQQIESGDIPALAGSTEEDIEHVYSLSGKLARLQQLTDSINSDARSWVAALRTCLAQGQAELFDRRSWPRASLRTLSDARIIKTFQRDADLFAFIDDEWSNFEGLDSRHHQPGSIHVTSMASEPRIERLVTREMISEVEIHRLASDLFKLSIVCYGQHKLEATAAAVTWIVGARP